MNRQEYKAYYSNLRYLRNITLTKLSLKIIDMHETNKELKKIFIDFPKKLCVTIAYDRYDSILCHGWVISRAMDIQNKTGTKAMQLSDKLKSMALNDKTEYPLCARDYRNKSFYNEKVQALLN